ncbi:MAG: hypothetical protein HFJ80_01870 [Clostridiales bacterium]|nr:hypothetical protein [Clostridiales bacterium]
MRIHIQTETGKRLCLLFPTRLMLNRLTAAVAAGILRRRREKAAAPDISSRELRHLFRTLRRMKRRHPGLPLVEVWSTGCLVVSIRL